MQKAIKTHAPEQPYIFVSLAVAMAAIVIDFLGSPARAVGVALLAYVISMLGILVKIS